MTLSLLTNRLYFPKNYFYNTCDPKRCSHFFISFFILLHVAQNDFTYYDESQICSSKDKAKLDNIYK